MWSSAAVVHLLQGSTCCAFRDGILHTLLVTSGYLSYFCLSIISNQSAHSPLTSDYIYIYTVYTVYTGWNSENKIVLLAVESRHLQILKDEYETKLQNVTFYY